MSSFEKDPTTESNIKIYRYMHRNLEEQSIVQWKIDVYVHDKKSTGLDYKGDWRKLMDAITEIEKDETINHITVSGKGTAIKFKTGEDIFVKVSKDIDKKQACWMTIIKYLEHLEKIKKE